MLPLTQTLKNKPTQILSQWIGWAFFRDLASGLSLTLSYMFSKTVTEQYPDKEKWVPFPRYRGHHFLNTNEEGDTNCVACELCAKICPCDCIDVVPFEDLKGNRRPKVFDIDLGRCLYCGLCEDACPANAIKLGQHYEYSCENSEELTVGRDVLMGMPRKSELGGAVFDASLSTIDGVHVKEVENGQGRDWWQDIRRN
ncbi:NADH-quinone oxidoreductase subunit I [Alphaproteobacteria bacterium 46_93_T64]|nr:NADH-quinone oxidoreductase subunit I [Alphaproteobacteria bacterium 46_93_T64]